ncbi:MAG: D-TA family PLP-dependent enzyme [Rhodothermales bacterium]|nr:D-TA family PLP-dependent enzyme [Rhodothermales bacterium]
MLVSDLPTPALLVEKSRLEANLAAVQARAEAQGVALRPHIKTHKCPELARLQVESGAQGLTVATVREAEAFAAAGFDDLVIAKEMVTEDAFTRIAALQEEGVRLAFCIDTLAGATAASHAFAEHAGVDVLIEVDTGHHRCGVRWDDPEADDVVRRMTRLPGLRVRGLLTHGGQSYIGPDEGETLREARVRAMREERDRLLAFAVQLGTARLLDPAEAVLSLGSTPSFSVFENAEHDGFRITEARPGNYVFHDAMQVALGTAPMTACALTAQATVISTHRDDDGTDRVFVDAGKKTFTTDTGDGTSGYGVLLHSPSTMKPLPHARIVGLSEEHGWIDVPGGSTFDVGDRVRIVPNHACVAVAMQSALYVVEGDTVVDRWAVVAR